MPADKSYHSIAAAILAGGRNSRMGGRNKAFIEMEGSFLVETTVGLLKSYFQEILIVTNAPQDYRCFEKDAIIISDLIKDKGPLGGIHAGLGHTTRDAVFFVACDMPFLHNDIIRCLLASFKEADTICLVPKIGSSIEPLCAVYKKALKDALELFLRKSPDRSVRSFLETVDTSYLDLDDCVSTRRMFKNLNTPDDLKEAGLS